jgi:ankyrin repeat protein
MAMRTRALGRNTFMCFLCYLAALGEYALFGMEKKNSLGSRSLNIYKVALVQYNGFGEQNDREKKAKLAKLQAEVVKLMDLEADIIKEIRQATLLPPQNRTGEEDISQKHKQSKIHKQGHKPHHRPLETRKGKDVRVTSKKQPSGHNVRLSSKIGGSLSSMKGKQKELHEKLFRAAENGDAAGILQLIASGAHTNVWNNKGESPLHRAAYKGYVEAVQALITSGACLYHYDELSWTPLHAAAYAGHDEVVRHLIKFGALDFATDSHQKTPLHLAAAMGHERVIKILVDIGAPQVAINAQDEDKATPLHLASCFSHTEAVKALLECHADVNVKDKDGRTPYDLAVQMQNAVMVAIFEQLREI